VANLASTFWNQGRWREAEELEVQVMETRKRVLGVEHPSTLTSMANLESTYRNQGRWEEAEELEVQVMETRKKVLGKEQSRHAYQHEQPCLHLERQGRSVEVLKLMEECVQMQTRILGIDHPHTLSSFATWNGWQTKRLEINTSAVKGFGKQYRG